MKSNVIKCSAPVIFLATFILHLHHLLSGAHQSDIFIGCYKRFREIQNARLSNRSFLQCVSTCKIFRLPFIAIKSGRTCHCGNITDSRVFSKKCDMLCSDVPHSCGGLNLYAVYAIVPSYLGCFVTEITNSTENLTLSCQEVCELEKFSYLADEQNLCKCWVPFNRFRRLLMSDCDEICKSTEECQNSFKTDVYSGDFILGLGKSYADVFRCLNSKPNKNATCDLGLCKHGWKGEKCEQRICSINNGECDKSECKEFQFGNTNYSECLCEKGYLYGLTLFENCRDENECSESLNPCDTSRSTCVNKIGSYSCSCFEGYYLQSGVCEDKDECLKKACPFEATICANTIGSYMCVCRAGYRVIVDEFCLDVPDAFSACSLNYFECDDGIENCKPFPKPGRCESLAWEALSLPSGKNFIDDYITFWFGLIIVCMIGTVILAIFKDKKIKRKTEEENRNNAQTEAYEELSKITKKKSSISVDIEEEDT